jgi:uncharacterized protein YcnI
MPRLRLLAATLAAAASLAAVPAAAQASFTVTPDTTQAGAASQVVIHTDFATDPTGGPLTLRLPAGLVGNPQPFARCSETQFRNDQCPAGSQVGSASANGLASGGVYNLAPQGDEPARLGIVVTLLGILTAHNEASVKVRPDGGLDSTIASVQTTQGIPVAISSLDLTLDSDFATLPTSCGAHTTTIQSTGQAQSASFSTTGCGAVPFAPTAGLTATNTQRTRPTGATVTLRVPSGGDPRQSHVRRASVALPQGVTLSPGVANGLQACTAGQFAGSACPAASQIGSVSFNTPLIAQALAGKVYFGQPAGGAYPLLVAVDDQGVHLKLTGTATLDPATGQITTVFDDLPQVPFTAFALTFQGGDRGLLANPSSCGSRTMTATLTPWSGGPAVAARASYAVTGCPAGGVPFRPTLAVSSASRLAGRPTGGLAITIARPDGDQDLGSVETALPPGLAGKLTGVPACPEAQAATGDCPAATRLGSVSALVGSGGAPVSLAGTVYLTGPAVGGLAGMAIVIPGRVGPVDLGTVVVRAGLLLRPADGGVTVRTAPLPPLVGGVPVSVRSLTLDLDRPGFGLNPSGCDVRTVTASLSGTEGATATATAPYQATDCSGLAYEPTLTASLDRQGPRGRRHEPALRTSIRIPAGQSATRKVVVALPQRLTLDPSAIKSVCTTAQAAADACPAASRVGSVSARTPLLPIGFSGPVQLVEVPGALLPGLRLALNGPTQLRLSGALDLGKGISAVFDDLPDVPLSQLDLTFAGGGPLRLVGASCTGGRLKLAGTLTGHNGKQASAPATARIRGCPATAAVALSSGSRPALRLKLGHGRDAKRLRRVVLGLPKGMSARKGAGRVRLTRDGGHRVRAKAVKVARRSITLTLPASRSATLRLDRGVLRGRPHGRAVVRLVRTNGKRFTVRATVKRLR